PAQDQGPEPPGVPRGVQRVPHRDQDGERAHESGERVGDLALDRGFPGPRDQVHDHLAVDGRLEERALADHLVAQRTRVRDVPVVHQGEVTLVVARDDRLRVLEARAAGRRITGMAEGGPARQLTKHGIVESVRDQPGRLDDARPAVVDRADPGGLLAPVLKRVEPEEHRLRGVFQTRYRYDPTHIYFIPPLM